MPSKYYNISYDYYSKDIPYSTRFQAIRGIQSEDQVNFTNSIRNKNNRYFLLLIMRTLSLDVFLYLGNIMSSCKDIDWKTTSMA